MELGSGEYEEDGAGDATSQRVYWVPFTFTFPPSCQSCMRSRSATLCQLPPSLDITASGIRAKSEYAIIATVKYHRLWWRTTTTTKELSLSPIPPITLLPTSCIASLPANKLLVPNGEADDLFAEVDPAWLPAYSPTLHLTMLLPQPPVLTRAQATPVQLVLQAPPELLRGEGLYLRNVMLHLRSTMMVRVGAFRQRSVGTSHVWSSRGLVRVDNTRFELNPGDWAVCAGRGMKPSFRSCALGLTYSLEVVAGLSRGTSGPVEVCGMGGHVRRLCCPRLVTWLTATTVCTGIA